jgi:hypothetical protein
MPAEDGFRLDGEDPSAPVAVEAGEEDEEEPGEGGEGGAALFAQALDLETEHGVLGEDVGAAAIERDEERAKGPERNEQEIEHGGRVAPKTGSVKEGL